MTLQEARKVIGLNIHNLNGSMQMAVATIMDALEEKAEVIGHLADAEDLKREWWNKGYYEGRKKAHIPAKELGLPKAWDFQQEQPSEDLEAEMDRFFEEMPVQEQ